MSRRNLHELPRFRDGWSFLYVEKAVVDREQNGLRIVDEAGRIQVPVAALSALLLGPGVKITHAAVVAAGDAGCSIAWCGEQGVRFYASGSGDDRRTENLHFQARAWADEAQRLAVVRRMYLMRFKRRLHPGLTLEQIRGMEGVRVREAYARASRETGVEWKGRTYRRGAWERTDAVNRALSAANACLHSICHSAVSIAGYSESLGFVHTGKTRAFVYDIADFYKVDLTVPLAFRAVADGEKELESRVRKMCRAAFYREKLLERIIPDIQRALGQTVQPVEEYSARDLNDEVLQLWDPEAGVIAGGQNYAVPGDHRSLEDDTPSPPSPSEFAIANDTDRSREIDDESSGSDNVDDDDEVPF